MIKKWTYLKRKNVLIFTLIFTITTWYIYLKLNYKPEKLHPIIFIGGFPRSGTTLMRILLDVHPEIRCGPESHVIPKFLNFRNSLNSENIKKKLISANLYPYAIDEASKDFIISIINNAGKPANILCTKDPFSFYHLNYLTYIFPDAKFINMIRDGRAVISSLHKFKYMSFQVYCLELVPNNAGIVQGRKVGISGFPRNINEQILKWENITKTFHYECNKIGSNKCINIFYENLVLYPSDTLHKIMSLVVHPFQLNHQNVIQNISYISPLEKSSSQVIHAINASALSSWYMEDSELSLQFKQNIHLNSTILKYFGYDKIGIPPNYSKFKPQNI